MKTILCLAALLAVASVTQVLAGTIPEQTQGAVATSVQALSPRLPCWIEAARIIGGTEVTKIPRCIKMAKHRGDWTVFLSCMQYESAVNIAVIAEQIKKCIGSDD